MAKAIALFEGGIHNRTQAAVREGDGRVFRRWQERDPRYGYKWTAWKATGECLGENAREAVREMSAGWSTMYRQDGAEKHVRLPN